MSLLPSSSEQRLISRVRVGEADALGEIVRLTAPRLVSFAFSFTRDRDSAEDIVQDVFAAVWHRRAEWQPTSLMAYLLTAVRNRAFKMARAHGVEERYRVQVDVEHQAAPSPAEVFDKTTAEVRAQMQLRALRAAFDGLSERQRSAYLLRYEQGLTIPQIAHVLGISEKGAEQLVRRTTQTLRERVRKMTGEA